MSQNTEEVSGNEEANKQPEIKIPLEEEALAAGQR